MDKSTSPRLTYRELLAALLVLALAIAITFSPIFGMGFVSDDFIDLSAIHFTTTQALARGDISALLGSWLHWGSTDIVNGSRVIRLTGTTLLLSDYLIWHLSPFGYHLTSLLLHLSTSFVVMLLGWKLSRNKWAAILAGFFFAIYPVHAEAVSWVSARDQVSSALFFALSFFFYIKGTKRFSYALSLIAFILALGAKEMAVTLPLILFLYEVLYGVRNRRGANQAEPMTQSKHLLRGRVSVLVTQWGSDALALCQSVAKRTWPFWLILLAYLGLRFILFKSLGTPPYARFDIQSLPYHVAGYTMFATDPLYLDINNTQAVILLVLIFFILWLYRARRLVLFGAAWIPTTLLVTVMLPVEARYFYIPSIGLALILGAIVANPLPARLRFSSLLRYALVISLMATYGAALLSRNQNWRIAGNVVERILTEVKALHPTMPPSSRLVFVDVPARIRRAFVFITGIEAAAQLAYQDPSLQAVLGENFPVITDRLDRTYFFEYENRHISERAELGARLATRRKCGSHNRPLVWNFSNDAQGWEIWNDIAHSAIQDRALELEVSGTDPILTSPLLEVPPSRLDKLEMALAADGGGTLNGVVYWQTASMADFSPGMNRPFTVQADGVMHVIQMQLSDVSVPAPNDPLVRIRIDPTDRPGKIRIASIRLFCRP